MDFEKRENLRAAAYMIGFGALIIYAGGTLIGIVAIVGGVVVAFAPTKLPADFTIQGWLSRRSQTESNAPIPWYYSPLPYVALIAIGLVVYASAN